MLISAENRAELLLESLPYIKKFYDHIVVIKYGGHAMVNEALKASVIRDIVLLKYVGMHPVIVHGGGPLISETMAKHGIEPTFIEGLRVTTPEVMTITEMVLTGSIAPSIASLFNANDVASVAMSGKDANTLMAEPRSEKLGQVGRIVKVNPAYLFKLIENDYVPVISPIATNERGQSFNINSDEAAGKLAGALGAQKLILMTDIDGVMEDPKRPETLFSRLCPGDIEELAARGVIGGGMIPKLRCTMDALAEGVKKCHILNGTIPHSLLLELFTNKGIGTMIEERRESFGLDEIEGY